MELMELMELLHSLRDFGIEEKCPNPERVLYLYQGWSAIGELLTLPRTELSQAIAMGLMAQLAAEPARFAQEAKMYGILLVATPQGERRVLKAFSGLLQGQAEFPGWVPPLPGRDRLAIIEQETLQQLQQYKQELERLQALPLRQDYEALDHTWQWQQALLNQSLKTRKQARQRQRQRYLESLDGQELMAALSNLERQSQGDSTAKQRWKEVRDQQLQPLLTEIQTADHQMQTLKQGRKDLSRQLQRHFHQAYVLSNFEGVSASIQSLFAQGPPTGTGDCCAPKLLHWAATHALTPLAMAEFWWAPGSPNRDRQSGQFYGACAERCQPMMGFLLSGLLPASTPDYFGELPILDQDDHLFVVDKPAGLLSVPGRTGDRQDSVLLRLQRQYPDLNLRAVHRLDQDTSGLLLIAKHLDSYRHYSHQFATAQVKKTYLAVLEKSINLSHGSINLPLWADLGDRPYQKVDYQRGKASLTEFKVIEADSNQTRILFYPHTGRTHQLRVHAAHPQGLQAPILGDRLYGSTLTHQRLHLHAQRLIIRDYTSEKKRNWQSFAPF